MSQASCLYYLISQSGSLQCLEFPQINLIYPDLTACCRAGHLRAVVHVMQLRWVTLTQFMKKPIVCFWKSVSFHYFCVIQLILLWKKSLSEVSLRRAFSIPVVISALHLKVSSQYPSNIICLHKPYPPCPKKGVSGRGKAHYFSTAQDNRRLDRLRLLSLLNLHHQIMFDMFFPHIWNGEVQWENKDYICFSNSESYSRWETLLNWFRNRFPLV